MANYFLRRQGYTMLARNWRAKGRKGEIDLIGWDGNVALLHRGEDPQQPRRDARRSCR